MTPDEAKTAPLADLVAAERLQTLSGLSAQALSQALSAGDWKFTAWQAQKQTTLWDATPDEQITVHATSPEGGATIHFASREEAELCFRREQVTCRAFVAVFC